METMVMKEMMVNMVKRVIYEQPREKGAVREESGITALFRALPRRPRHLRR
jgi:hypothetical protein